MDALILFCSAIVLLLLALLLLQARRQKPTLPLPPGPWGFPVIGAIPLIGREPHKGLDRLAKRYGPLMYLKIGPHGTVVVSSQAAARAFFKTVDTQFANRPYFPSIETVSYDSQDLIFAPYSPRWRMLRKLSSLHMLGGRAISEWASVRREEVGVLIRTMHDSESPLGIRDAVMRILVNVIGRVALGRTAFWEESGELQCIIRDMLTGEGVFNIGDVVPSLAWMDLQGAQKKARRMHERFDALISKLIADHAASAHERADDGRYDFLDLVMANLTDADGEKLSEINIKGLILDLFTAGTDTSKISTEWALAEMLANPAVMKRAQLEMDRVIGRDRRLEESDLPSLPYLQAVCKETLRMHPPTPLGLPHYSYEACEVNGYYIPPNTQLLVNLWAIGRDPDVWEEPLEFKPERFLSGTDNNDSELMAFGAGRRICAGKQTGMLMMQYIVGSLVHSFDLKLPDGEGEIDMREKFEITVPKAVPLMLVGSPRLASAAYA